jgi:hypothetical protein
MEDGKNQRAIPGLQLLQDVTHKSAGKLPITTSIKPELVKNPKSEVLSRNTAEKGLFLLDSGR